MNSNKLSVMYSVPADNVHCYILCVSHHLNDYRCTSMMLKMSKERERKMAGALEHCTVANELDSFIKRIHLKYLCKNKVSQWQAWDILKSYIYY